MTYKVGELIKASDINDFIADVNEVIGLGNGDFGYGATELSNVNPGDPVDEQLWRDLRNNIATAAQHQGTTVNIPPLSVLEQGDVIQAHESDSPTNDPSDIDSSITAIRNNRLNSTNGNMTITSVGTVTRNTNWGNNIFASVRIDFGTEDAARHFFNSGGQIEFDGDQPFSGGQPQQDNNWRDVLNNKVGELRMTYNSFTRSGSGGFITRDWGYYDLSSSFQRLYTGNNIGTGAYSSNDVQIEARAVGVNGTRGGNGSAIEFQIFLSDQHSGIGFSYDSVRSGTNFDFRARRSVIFGIPSPSFNIQNNF